MIDQREAEAVDREQQEAVTIENGRTYGKEAIAALRSAPPVQEPVRLTRQSARRLAMQIAWAKLRGSELNRAERRRLWHTIKFSDAARALVASTSGVTDA